MHREELNRMKGIMSRKEKLFDANRAFYRFIVLFFNCLLTFGSYFCFDLPSVLQDRLTGHGINCTDYPGNTTRCKEHLGLTETEYNLLYSIYAWMNAMVVIFSGILVDKCGHRMTAVVFSGGCALGSSIFAVGYYSKGTRMMFPMFLFGRFIFGASNGSLTISQNCISAYWFQGRELAFAFGLTLVFSRTGSILNFLFTEHFASMYGLQWTLWGGAFLCGLGFFASVILYHLDKRGAMQLEKAVDVNEKLVDDVKKKKKKKMQLNDLRRLPIDFWLLVITTMLFYNTVFPFVADASKFIKQKYGYSDKTSSYIAGSVYDISLPFTPIMGILVDFLGYRGILAASCAVFTIPVFAILAFTSWHPLFGTLLLGVTYSAAACSLWPTVPLVVSPKVLGTAMGLMTAVQMVGIGISSLIVGNILDKTNHNWKYVMLFLFANAVMCVVSAIFLNVVDYRKKGIMNKTGKYRGIQPNQQINEFSRDTDALIEENGSINT